jgi:hypothetical protein
MTDFDDLKKKKNTCRFKSAFESFHFPGNGVQQTLILMLQFQGKVSFELRRLAVEDRDMERKDW